MKKNLTELVFILDRSGSMAGLESDTIGGFNALLEKQKKADGEANVTTLLFDDCMELLHDRISIKGVAPITDRDYFVRGSTALLDAIGFAIRKLVNVQRQTATEEQASKVMFVITTDGMENASKEYTYGRIKEMIEHQKRKYQWEFLFLGANIDAVKTAGSFGIHEDYAVNYHSDAKGTALNYEVLAEAVTNFRESKPISKKWKSRIEADYENRKND